MSDNPKITIPPDGPGEIPLAVVSAAMLAERCKQPIDPAMSIEAMQDEITACHAAVQTVYTWQGQLNDAFYGRIKVLRIAIACKIDPTIAPTPEADHE